VLGELRFLFPPSLGKAKASARAELLEGQLAAALGRPVIVDVAKDYGDLESRALGAEADIVWAPSGVCARLESGARAVFKVVRGGSSTYRAALVARSGSRVSLATLTGLRAAWVDPLSVGGYLLVRDHLVSLAIDPDTVFASQTFVGSHPAVIDALVHGAADVGAVTVPRLDEKSVREAISLYAGDTTKMIEAVTISDDAPTDAIVLTHRLSRPDARAIELVLAPSGIDARPPACLLFVMEAETLVRARPGEYEPVLRLIRSNGAPRTRR
jgi:phosphonate transport system substrate-binding protein